jgi:lysozyme
MTKQSLRELLVFILVKELLIKLEVNNMKISDLGINLIKKFEGFSDRVYICSGGYKTIGYGHVLTDNDNIELIDQNEAELLLNSDIKKAERSVMQNIDVPLNQNQFDALVSFVFNLGGAALQRSALRQKINRLEHNLAAQEFTKWIYAGGKIMPGLLNRRYAESELYSL